MALSEPVVSLKAGRELCHEVTMALAVSVTSSGGGGSGSRREWNRRANRTNARTSVLFCEELAAGGIRRCYSRRWSSRDLWLVVGRPDGRAVGACRAAFSFEHRRSDLSIARNTARKERPIRRRPKRSLDLSKIHKGKRRLVA